MERVPEAELMDDPEQAEAYAAADFAEVNQGFVDRFRTAFPEVTRGRILDLGCGPADIPVGLARALPGVGLVALDGSAAMLSRARDRVTASGLGARVRLVAGRVPLLPFPSQTFDAVVSNSLVHHLRDPAGFWTEAVRLARPGAPLFVMDLFRPESRERAWEIVLDAAARESPILQRDFFQSLCAAFTPVEVQSQLAADLPGASCTVVSERHWLVAARVGGRWSR